MIVHGIKENIVQFYHQLIQVFFVGMTLGTVRTVIPALAEEEFAVASGSFLLISTFVLAFGVVKACMNFAAGHLADKFGRKKILLFGWLLALPVPFLILYAESWAYIVVATTFLGINQGLTWSITQTCKIDLADPSERGFAIGLNEFSGYIGVSIAGILTGILVTSYDIRQAIFFTGNYLVSVAPTSGKIYWKYPWKTSFDVNASTPIFIPSDKLFISSGYGVGATTLQMKLNNESIDVEEVWRSKVMKNQFGTAVLNGDYLFGFDDRILVCINANTGKEMWKQRGYGQGTLILADNHLIILSDKGKLALAEVSSSGFKEKAGMQVLNGTCWTVPTLSGGKLYLRSMNEIVCLQITNE